MVLCVHLFRHAPGRASETQLLLSAGLVGLVADTLVKACGALSEAGPSCFPALAPAWLLPLWLIFATTLNGSMSWMADRIWLGVLFGAVGGPLSYWSGARMGALQLRAPLVQSLAWIALEWAIAMPVLLGLRARITGPRP